ncbi:MarR family winged helix-turn-helix transcriptional regulator [Novipirellula caenicola]|uniref:Transcriptional regulator SlyA n=1 Tax=Novipirellula caenicola TaxID=1536901 RepID=A0ABP9VLE1_9BACT
MLAKKGQKRSTEKWRELGTIQETVVVDLRRTDDQFQYHFGRLFREYGLTEPQYNVLRILRAAGEPLPSLEVAARLIAITPAITNLLDKLEKKKLIARKRCNQDRRVWFISITASGSKLLAKMDEPVAALHQSVCEGMTEAECKRLVALLAKARSSPLIAEQKPN